MKARGVLGLTLALRCLKFAWTGRAASSLVVSCVITASKQLPIGLPRHSAFRRPQGTPILEHLRVYLPSFLDVRAATPPRFIQCELERYIRCGDIRFGHATLACTRCGFEHD